MTAPTRVGLYTHQRPDDTAAAVKRLVSELNAAGIVVQASPGEIVKHPSSGLEEVPDPGTGADLGVVLGGDGTILRSLREFAGSGVPTFSVNYGAIGFLATVDDLEDGIRRVVAADFEVTSMPALAVGDGEVAYAAGDVSFHRHPGARVAELAYYASGEQLGEVRCDGLVASTPVGSTGYNLANGGPLLAWGVEGFVVSFIAPHSLTARAVVLSPNSRLTVESRSREPLDMTTDGRPAGELAPGATVDVRFEADRILLAQLPGTSFYQRLREKFGRIAN